LNRKMDASQPTETRQIKKGKRRLIHPTSSTEVCEQSSEAKDQLPSSKSPLKEEESK